MLIKATLNDIEKYGDFIYGLALDQSRSCYPTYSDGIKTKADFIANSQKCVTRENWELLLFSIDDKIEGWVQYYWIPEERYLQLYSCNIRRQTEQALSELIELFAGRFLGYTAYFGFPEDNSNAISFLQQADFSCIEEDWNNTLFFEEYELLPEDGNIVKVESENADDFRAVYHPEPNTYWDCERILAQLDEWAIFLCYKDGKPVGTLFLQDDDEHCEIFGSDFTDICCQAEVHRALLVSALNYCKSKGVKYMTYFCGDDLHNDLLSLGFKCIGKYVLYIKEL